MFTSAALRSQPDIRHVAAEPPGNWTIIADRIDAEQNISGQVVIRWLNRTCAATSSAAR